MKVLTGYTSPDTAYVVQDYPYGFRLRTQIRYWIETRRGFGQRPVSQTMNPKTQRWNKPKYGIYHAVAVMYVTEDGHVHFDGMGSGCSRDVTEAWIGRYAPALEGDYEREAVHYLRAVLRVNDKVTWVIHTCDGDSCADPQHNHAQTPDEQQRILKSLVRHELRQDAS